MSPSIPESLPRALGRRLGRDWRSGKLEITVGSAQPVEAESGQAFFLEKGTLHGFGNIGSGPATVIEVFVK